MKESQIEAKMVRLVRERGGLCYKWESPGNPGVPDRIVVTPAGGIYFCELKTEIGRLAKIQKYQHRLMEEHGVEVYTLRGWEEVKQFVEAVMPK